jgi:3-oxoacyl-[acyl-carrier protein] reductase
MELGLRNRVALVTGASRGIGKGIALELAHEGCKLCICARGEEALTTAAAELEDVAGPGNVLAMPLDITARDSAELFTRAALDTFGAIDIVINNAGGNRRKPFAETTDLDWDELIELNMLGGLRLARAALPTMVQHGRGVILFTVSIWGREGGGYGYSIYTSTRAAVIGAAKTMALELAPLGIRVNCIAPGSIHHPGGSWDVRMRRDPEKMAEFIERNLPMKRFGTVEEIAALAAFLCSDRASLISGACVPADGVQGKTLI